MCFVGPYLLKPSPTRQQRRLPWTSLWAPGPLRGRSLSWQKAEAHELFPSAPVNLREGLRDSVMRTMEETFKKSFSRCVASVGDPSRIPKKKVDGDGSASVTR